MVLRARWTSTFVQDADYHLYDASAATKCSGRLQGLSSLLADPAVMYGV